MCCPFKVTSVFTYSIAHTAESCKLKTLKIEYRLCIILVVIEYNFIIYN